MRRLVALAVAVVLTAGLAGCSAPPSTRRVLWSGFMNSVIFSCLDRLTVTPGAFGSDSMEIEVGPGRAGWLVRIGELRIERSADETESWSVSTTYIAEASRVVPAFLRCVDRYRIDWSLARADSPLLRAQLYRYYSEELIPCLAPWGVDASVLPSQSDFVAEQDRFDPYQYVHAEPRDALVIEQLCPPAPINVLAAVSRGSG